VPARKPVWTASRYIRAAVQEQCRDGVFFTTSWRAAVTWAEAAHLHARGRRNSVARNPVIIRIPKEGLEIETDRMAASPGCVFVRGAVSVVDAGVFLGPLAGFPTWKSLNDVVANQ
jgi:hypothetical protein